MQCNHALLEPGWRFKLCPECLTRVREANEARDRLNQGHAASKSAVVENKSYRTRAALVVPSQTSGPPMAFCYFCNLRIFIPNTHASGPLVCESCYKLALVQQRQAREFACPPHPSSIIPLPLVPPQVQSLPSSVTTLNLPGPYLMRPKEHKVQHFVDLVPLVQRDVQTIPNKALPGLASTRIARSAHPGNPDPLPVLKSPSTDLVEDAADPGMDLDDLELAYPEDDELDLVLPVEADEELQSPLSSSSPPPENDGSSIYEIPDGWSSMSDLTELPDSDVGESEVDSDLEKASPSGSKSGLKIRIRIPPGYSFDNPPNVRVCGIKRCENRLEPGSRWKLCHSCRNKFRRYQRHRLHIKRPRLDLEEGAEVGDAMAEGRKSQNNPSDKVSSRCCTIRTCRKPLPPEDDYRWKMCEPCRMHMRFQQKRRRAIALLMQEDDSDASRGSLARYIIEQYEKQQAKRKRYGLDSDEGEEKSHEEVKEVEQPNAAVRSGHLEGMKEDIKMPDKSDLVRSASTFQHLSELLDALHAYLTGFLHAQIRYIGVKLRDGISTGPLEPFIFAFDGEFSFVTDAPLDSETTRASIMTIRQSLQDLLALDFKPIGEPNTKDDELIAQFGYFHTFILQIPSTGLQEENPVCHSPAVTDPAPASLDSIPAITRKMAGEVEIRVTKDQRHPLFAGQRAIIRFRLVG
ncbi:hypothetical protein EW146_g5016 [Bondarzewia mesenterica]|uniref:Uncharacterized protein n=1 Tax=Bondarzewia mesenterica TaxID=1095465 RepID=A0A4S4LSR8_9AGAM|nr:hypothetical protein EW146_g5016 [Bondarzewia mesenterica]